jgi:hypothetical protein
MIDRFNFYDLYGYVIPGFVLITLFWLPFGWTGWGWPSHEWTSAVAALAVSYTTGILLQSVGTHAVPSTAKGGRHPSDFLLDEKDTTLSSAFKTELTKLILIDFSLPVSDKAERAEAFHACRAALVVNKMATYAEQFQGLYALARGLLLSIGLAIPFFLGWAISLFRAQLLEWTWWSVVVTLVASVAWFTAFAGDDCKKSFASWKWSIWVIGITVALPTVGYAVRSVPALAAILFAGPRRTALWVAIPFLAPLVAVLTDRKRLRSCWGRRSIAFSTFAIVAALGFAAARTSVSTADQGQQLVGCAIAAAIMLFPLWQLYRAHTEAFAATVYRDYVALRKVGPPTPSSGGGVVGTNSGR